MWQRMWELGWSQRRDAQGTGWLGGWEVCLVRCTCPRHVVWLGWVVGLPAQDAHEAFQAVAHAAKVLQDSSSRAALDEHRQVRCDWVWMGVWEGRRGGALDEHRQVRLFTWAGVGRQALVGRADEHRQLRFVGERRWWWEVWTGSAQREATAGSLGRFGLGGGGWEGRAGVVCGRAASGHALSGGQRRLRGA